MRPVLFTSPTETISLLLTGRKGAYKLRASFWPTQFPKFLRALEQKFRVNEIRRLESGEWVSAIFFYLTEDDDNVVELLNDIFEQELALYD